MSNPRPTSHENPPPSSRFDASILSNRIREGRRRRRRRRACCCITWFWNVRLKDVARRAWIKRDRFVLGTVTRGRREGEEEGPSIVPKLCEPVPFAIGSSVGKLFGLALGTCQITILIETIIKFHPYSSSLSFLLPL